MSQFDDFVRAYESDEYLPVRRHIEAHSFFRALGDVSGLSVLDVGCGAGLYTRLLRERGARQAVGLDAAENMITYARSREAEEGRGIQYVVDDVTNAAAHGPVDVVTAIYVLPYASDADSYCAMAKGIYDALQPGGRLVAMPLAPTVCYEPDDYYRPYGFTLHPDRADHQGLESVPDFAPLRLRTVPEEIPLDVVAYHLSSATQEQLLWKVGFSSLTWHRPEASAEGIDRFGAAFWQDYLDRPHSAPLVCVK
ncbi:MAG TPA: class I SAM-dependent methyltransferase [Acidimicrobiales bacterium]|nr:class I SAM-dependent methyltransferase [Acidimicrobiales bacterium]